MDWRPGQLLDCPTPFSLRTTLLISHYISTCPPQTFRCLLCIWTSFHIPSRCQSLPVLAATATHTTHATSRSPINLWPQSFTSTLETDDNCSAISSLYINAFCVGPLVTKLQAKLTFWRRTFFFKF